MKLKYCSVLPILAVTMLGGCSGGSGEGLPSTSSPAQPVAPPTDSEAPTLSDLQDEVLSPICAQCHVGNSAPFGLSMESLAISEANLINMPSGTNPSIMRIAPGDPDNSFLFMKIIGDPLAGNRMPLGQSPLNEEVIARFRAWIEGGAPISSAAVQVSKVSTMKAEGKIKATVQFNQNIDTRTLSSEAVEWEASSEGFSSPYYPQNVNFYWHSHSLLEIEMATPGVDIDTLTFHFNLPSHTTVMSQQGYWLDGDANGQEGGVFSYELSL